MSGFARVGLFLDTSGKKIREKQSWSNESVAEQVGGGVTLVFVLFSNSPGVCIPNTCHVMI